MAMQQPFWRTKTLAQMTRAEWESLCDGCGKCCLQKLQDDDSGEVYATRLVCHYMTPDCRCSVYDQRQKYVPNCVWLTPDDVNEFFWLPSTCAYRLVAEGQDLPAWHPLLAGDADRIHQAKASIKHWDLIADDSVPEDDWEDYIIDNL